jgi:hydrogenase small subunit
LQYCTASAAALGLSQTDLLKLEKAMATPQTGCTSPSTSVVWIEGQCCTGCQVSLLNRVVDQGGAGGYYDGDLLNLLDTLYNGAANPVSQGTPSDPVGTELNVVMDAADLLVGDAVSAVVPQLPALFPRAGWAPFNAGYVTLELLHTVQAGAGDINVAHLASIVNSGNFVMLMDGSIPTTDPKYCLVFDNEPVQGGGKIVPSLPAGSVTLSDALRWMLPQAIAAIAIGTCCAYGGIPAGKRNKTGAISLPDFAANEGIATPIIDVPGCPPHPDWIVYPVAYFLIHGAVCPLDEHKAPWLPNHLGRPDAVFGNQVLCHSCPNYDTQGTANRALFLGDDGCQATNGCKGPASMGDCNVRMKNIFDDGTKSNWCAASGESTLLNPASNIGEARYVCHGCIEPDFPDGKGPFFEPLDGYEYPE